MEEGCDEYDWIVDGVWGRDDDDEAAARDAEDVERAALVEVMKTTSSTDSLEATMIRRRGFELTTMVQSTVLHAYIAIRLNEG